MKIFKRAIKEMKKYIGLYIVAMVSTVLLAVVNLIAPTILSKGIATISSGISSNNLNDLLLITGILLGLYALRVLFRFMSGYLSHIAAWKLVEELRIKVYNKLQSFSLSYYKDKQAGDLTSRVVIDTENFEHLYAHIIPEGITNSITLIGVSVILFCINWKLALITFITIPPVLYSAYFFATRVRPSYKRMLKANGELSAQLIDNFTGMKETQVFRQEKRATGNVKKSANNVTINMLKALKLSGIFHPVVEFLTSIGTVIVIGVGGYLSFKGDINSQDIVTFILYLTLFYAPITSVAQLMENAQLAFGSVERVSEILDSPILIKDCENAKDIGKSKGELVFKNVSFEYEKGLEILKDVSFTAKAGQTIAFIGATGTGKTTLTSLISRFYEPTKGTILLDNININELKLDCLRSNISSVLQDTFLFNGTIRENIAFANPKASYDEIVEVSKKAFIHEDIMKMPQGYDTLVGERGTRLSGGQKQRIAIARAILHQTPILILDEATASIDVTTEEQIQNAINSIHGTKTVIVIAHRLSTIRKADKIIVLENGKIIEEGTHEELMSQNGRYSKMIFTNN